MNHQSFGEKEDLFHESKNIEEEILENNKQITTLQKDIMKIYSEEILIEDNDTQEMIEAFSMTNIKEFNRLQSKFLDVFTSTIDEISILAQIGKQNMTFKVNTLSIEKEGKEAILNLSFQLERNFFEPQFFKEEEEKKKEKEFDDFKPIPIEKAIAFNDKLSNNLHKLENNTETRISNTGGRKNTSTMKVLIENGEIKTSRVLEKFDEVVLESIYSLIQKNQFFDVQMLKDEMTQNKNRHKGEIDKAIEKSLNKLSTTKIQIEIPEELQKTMKTDFDKIGIKEIILPLREYYVVKGGHKKSVFGLTSNSIYFEYAKARGQLITKDVKLLQGGIGNATKESIILVHYISSRIADMKHQKEKNKSGSYIQEIKLQTIWEYILSDDDLKMKKDSLQRKKRRYIEQIKTILENYKKDKEIKDFKEYSEGFQIKI